MGLDYREVFHFFRGNAMLFQYLIHQVQVQLVFVLHSKVTLSVFGDIAFLPKEIAIGFSAGNIIVVNGDGEHFLKAFFGIHAGSIRRATVLFDQGIFQNGRHRPVITGQGSPGLQQTRRG